MKVSFIIPVYNAENYLARCVESILSLTSIDFELILVDDGSKDNSWNIIEKTPFINNEQAWWAYSLSKQSLHIDGYGDMDEGRLGLPIH